MGEGRRSRDFSLLFAYVSISVFSLLILSRCEVLREAKSLESKWLLMIQKLNNTTFDPPERTSALDGFSVAITNVSGVSVL